MSLNIYFEGIDRLPDLPIMRDVQTLFLLVRLDGCDYDRAILQDIEEGQYIDNVNFIDRFGRTLPYKYLSSGTKAALALYHLPNVIVWGAEFGRNALAEIVKKCTQGTLLLPAQNYYIACSLKDSVIDIMCSGKHYTSLHHFAEYMMEDAPYD